MSSNEARASGEAVIETHGLTKVFGKRVVVDGIDIAVPPRAVAGFVGPNGAGKTTTLRMLLGLIKPSDGSGRVLGVPLTSPAEYLPRVGALVEGPAFYPALSGARNLAVQAALSGHDPVQIPALLERVGLADRGDDPYKAYSQGMKQRLGIAAALLGDPELLMLDEPTNGIDPAGIRQMRGLLRSLTDEHRTVIISSHLLAEVQQICDWLIVIENGKRIFQGSTQELLAGGEAELVLATEKDTELARLQALLERRGVVAMRSNDHLSVSLSDLKVTVGSAEARRALGEINRAAIAEEITLVEMTVVNTSLEDRYMALTSGVPQ
jgi:ABC-2 type transport system ATP-binding protein